MPQSPRVRTPASVLAMLNTLFLTLLLAACGSLDNGPRAGADREDGHERQAGAIAHSASQLQLLPQNTRYFQYNGLPMVLFGNQAGLAPTPTATFDPDHLEKVSRHGNSLFTAAHPTWVDASYEELLAALNDDAHCAHLGTSRTSSSTSTSGATSGTSRVRAGPAAT